MLPRMRRNLRRPTLALLLVTPAVVGCVNAPSDRVAAPPTGDTATWEVDPERRPTRDAQRVEVLVTRLGCASGKTGEVLPPDVREEDDQVVVTFAVERLARRDQTCPGNAPVPGGVDLDRPLGDRELLDGACLSGEAATTAACVEGPQRWPSGETGAEVVEVCEQYTLTATRGPGPSGPAARPAPPTDCATPTP